MKTTLTRPCAHCPFRRASVPGWLGPWGSEQLLHALGREPFPCHCTVPLDRKTTYDDPALQACAGAAIFLNNKREKSRDPVTLRYQNKLRSMTLAVRALVFGSAKEFRSHHGDVPATIARDTDKMP